MCKRIMIVSLMIFIIAFVSVIGENKPVWAKSSDDQTVRTQVQNAEAFFSNGNIEQAATFFEQAEKMMGVRKFAESYPDAVIHLAQSYQARGLHKNGIALLQNALKHIEIKEHSRKALFHSSLADVLLSYGDKQEAVSCLEEGVKEAELSKNSLIQAKILNDLGNVFAAFGAEKTENYDKAVSAYRKAISYIGEKDNAFAFSVMVNLIRVRYFRKDFQQISDDAENLLKTADGLPDTHHKAMNLISLGEILIQTQKASVRHDPALTRLAYTALTHAGQIGKTLNDIRIISNSYGYTGQLYEKEEQYADAKVLTRTAIFFIEQGKYPEILYLWQWQMGRLHEAEQDMENALAWYGRAVETLNPVRNWLYRGYRLREDVFGEKIKPVYLDLARLYLRQAEKGSGSERIKKARDTMELLKTAELENFYQDECVSAGRKKMDTTEQVSSGTAVIYPIPFSDRLAVIADLPAGIQNFFVPVKSETLGKTAMNFRNLLQNWGDDKQIEKDAETLYTWLIAPIENPLKAQNIHTLMIAADGALRLIPFSALYDGKQFLVQKYAVVTIPSRSLTDTSQIERTQTGALISGLSQGRIEEEWNFSALPGVAKEVKDVESIVGGKKLIDNDYTVHNLFKEFETKEYSTIHFATHGVFGNSPQNTFLLSYDGRLTMNQLEQMINIGRFRKNNVDLLTLSACQTAQGDERAAFGLAGIAVKAGVSSAIATLWAVDDSASKRIVTEFYRHISASGATKAESLRQAQIGLLRHQQFWHPSFWSPFLLIGNWN